MKTILKLYGFAFLFIGLTELHSQTENDIKNLLNQEFSLAVTGATSNALGNFAALDLTDAKVDFGGNILVSPNSILNVKASGGVSEGVLPIFSGFELNPDLSLGVQYNYRMSNYYEVLFSDIYERDIDHTIDSIKYIYNIKMARNDTYIDSLVKKSEKDSISLKKDSILLVKKIMALDKIISEGKYGDGRRIIDLSPEEIDSFKIIRNAAKVDASVLGVKIKYLNKRLAEIKKGDYKDKEFIKLSKKKATLVEDVLSKRKILGYKIAWLSFGYKLNGNSFRLYNNSKELPFEKQIEKKSFASHEVNVQFSWYKCGSSLKKLKKGSKEEENSIIPTHYYAVGMNLKWGNNLDDLTSKDFTEIVNLGPNPQDRYTTKNYKAYNYADYDSTRFSASIFADFYWFLLDRGNTAFHFYPTIKYADNKATFNSGFGMLLSFQKEKGGVVNAELFSELTDLFNAKDSEKSLFKRSTYGLRFTFPIKFKTNPES